MGVPVFSAHLPIAYAVGLLIVILIERLLHAFVWLCVSLVAAPVLSDPSSMVTVSHGVLSGSLQMGIDLMKAWLAAVGGLAQWSLYYVPMVLIFFSAMWVMSLVASTQSGVVRDVLFMWNNGISSVLRSTLIVPLQLVNLVFSVMVPFWNALAYFWKGMLHVVLVPMIQLDMEDALKGVSAGTAAIEALAGSTVSFVSSLVSCSDVGCLSVGARVFDFLGPMLHVRMLVSYTLLFARQSCVIMTPVLDIIAYPFLDSNFAQAVHAGLNAVLYTVVQLPLVTYARCEQAANDTDRRLRSLACTPDVAPVFNFATASVRYTGLLVDNWLDVTWVTILYVFGMAPKACVPASAAFKWLASQTLFGGNETRLVGLGGTSYALTDGNSVQYTFFRGATEQVFARDHWPFQVEPALGIAAIQYDSAEAVDDGGYRTMSMLGCVCQDIPDDSVRPDGTRMEIHCSIARYQSEEADEALDPSGLHVPVTFALKSTAYYMECNQAKIVVDSVRWPVSRLSKPGSLATGGRNWNNPLDELASGDGTDSPVEADAVIWVIPACGTTGHWSLVCLRTFQQAACFPYCLAVRTKGSASQGLVLYNADDWARNVQLQGRDCSGSHLSKAGLSTSVQYMAPGLASKDYSAVITDSADILGKDVVVGAGFVYDPSTMACVASDTVTSRLNRSAVASIDSRYEAILMKSQPFAVAGGVALTAVYNDDGTVAVRVQRLFGEEGTDVFTLVTTHSQLPAIAPCKLLSECDKLPNPNQVSIPFPWFSSPARHNPAVETRWGVFYAVNPSLDMFSQYSRYCRNEVTTLQFQAFSSYGGIRIWRVDAFAFTTPDTQTGSTGSSIEFPDVFGTASTSNADMCGTEFNVLVTSMEYLNSDNIAITVLRTAAAYIDTETMTPLPGDPGTWSYVTHFLHPVTMQLSDTHMWLPDSAVTQLSSGSGTLCPEWRQMPQFGSMAAEMAASAILATRMMVTFLITAPTVLQSGALERIADCPLVPRGHTMLLNCGRDFLSLDASFAAMRVANSHLWNSLSKLGRLFSGMPGGSSIHTFLHGAALYNTQVRTPLLTRRAPRLEIDKQYANVHDYALNQYKELVAKAQDIPRRATDMIKEAGTSAVMFGQKLLGKSKEFASSPSGFKIGAQFFASPPSGTMRRLPGFSIGVSAFGASVIDTTQFAWRFVIRIVLKLLSTNAAGLAPVMWQVLADSTDDFEMYLVKPGFRACAGLGVMLGYSNPWARLFRESCSSAVATQATAVTAVRVLFVEIPALACICRDAEGKNFAVYAREACWGPAPNHIKPLIASLISASEAGLSQKNVCKQLGVHTDDSMRSIMDPVMQHAYAATEAVGSTLDYLTIMINPDAGSCMDLVSSPYTMAIVPEPIDYFRSCGKTETCRSKCLMLFNEFEAIKNRFVSAESTFEFTSNVDKKFFSSSDVFAGRAAPPFQVLAMLEAPAFDLSDADGPCCGGNNALDRCILVSGINKIDALEVVQYCVPNRLDIGTHEHTRWSVIGSDSWSSELHSVRFANRDSLIVNLQGSVRMYNKNGYSVVLMEPLPAESLSWIGQARMHKVAWVFVAPGNFAVVHGFVNRRKGAFSEETAVCVDLTASYMDWEVKYCTHNLQDKLHDHVATCLGVQCSELLLLPTVTTARLRYCVKEIPEVTYSTSSTFQYKCVDSAPTPRLAQDLGFGITSSATYAMTNDLVGIRRTPVLCSNTLQNSSVSDLPRAIFSANPTSSSATWLEEVRIGWDLKESSMLLSSTKAASQTILAKTIIMQRCDVDDCTGCLIPGVQRACFAAQQCAVAKCIGTVVNLERPMCSVGRLLQAGLDVDLAKIHGIWTVLTDLVSFVLRAATGVEQDGLELEFIDEIFFSLLCEAKSGIIASMSILTSLINGIVNSADRASRAQMQNTHKVDQEAANAEAVRTMTAAATTNFLSQIAIGVLYVPIVVKKSLMCHTDAFLQIFESTGFVLEISSKKYAKSTTALVGRCLSEYSKESTLDPESPESQAAFKADFANVAVDAGVVVAQIPFEHVMHAVDGGFSYAIGIVSGLQDLIATADQKHCNLPDTEADEMQMCACGDHPVQIPTSRGAEGLVDGAFWCSGMLTLMSPMGESYIGFNPYSYNEIITAIGGSNGAAHDNYLQCISSTVDGTSCGQFLPTLPHLDMQGISLFTVAARCKSNYANSQWDEGAASLFSDTSITSFVVRAGGLITIVDDMRKLAYQNLPVIVVECLRVSLYESQGNDACLQDFLTHRAMRRQVFFQYVPVPTNLHGTQHIAGCEVFTGPAESKGPGNVDLGRKFRACLDEYDDVGCTLPGMVWAGRSANRVPVATPHARVEKDNTRRYETAAAMMETIIGEFDQTVATMSDWNAEHLDLALFTAEGDALHQLFDALVMGPYARAQMWPSDGGRDLPQIEWYRDTHGGTTREFEFPCTGKALRDVNESPFTCGSATRRAVIRYFMREHFQQASGNVLAEAVTRAVQEMITQLNEVWSDASVLGCICTKDTGVLVAGDHSVQCCDINDENGFLPVNLQSVQFTTIPGSEMTEEIFGRIGDFVKTDLWSNEGIPFSKYNLDLKMGRIWSEEDRILAAEYGILHSDIPLLSYGEDETAEPFGGTTRNISMWRRCHGFLQQTLSTLPIGNDGLPVGIFEHTPLDATSFSGEDAVRELERVVRVMTQKAWEVSPLHYSHVMRHMPSDSLLCETSYNDSAYIDEIVSPRKIQREYISNVDILPNFAIPDMATIHPHAGGIGSARFTCLCGWVDSLTGMCYLPIEVCTMITWSTVSDTLETYCARADMTAQRLTVPRPGGTGSSDGDKIYHAVIDNWISTWECDAMAPSESWGILNASSMDEWMLGEPLIKSPVSVRQTLEEGRAGLRIASLTELLKQKTWKTVRNPNRRTVSPTGAAGSSLGQRWCVNNSAEMLPVSLADRFIDELFPVAQGVTESAGLAVCLRVVVEAARLRALQLVVDDLSGEAAERLNRVVEGQETVVTRWRKRCQYQVEMVSMCALRGIFDIPPKLEKPTSCPFTLTNMPELGTPERDGTWLTPACVLRWHDGLYYYPCLCRGCQPNSGVIPAYNVYTIVHPTTIPSCKLPLDPHKFANTYKHTSSLFWPVDYTDETDPTIRSQLALKTHNLHTMRQREHTGVDLSHILDTYVRHTDASAEDNHFGNTDKATPWFSAEGLAETEGVARFCDLIHDWWPENWEQPVGVHVTTPCHSSETAYRGFDSAFTVDRTLEEDGGLPRMVYNHDTLRDTSRTGDNVGVSGVCRLRSVGMPIQEINTVRFCTRMDINAKADTAAPVQRPASDTTPNYVTSCAQSAKGVPWDVDDGTTPKSYGKTAGVVLSWPVLEEGLWMWPSGEENIIPQTVSSDVIESTWGSSGCGMPRLFTCEKDADCQSLQASSGTLKCMVSDSIEGVCMLLKPSEEDEAVVQCVKHLDCDDGQMCAGDGRCVSPVASFYNTRLQEIEVHMYADSQEKSNGNVNVVHKETYGHSPWEQVPDLLRSHGLCSHRKWHEYRHLLNNATCPPSSKDDDGSICTVETHKNSWLHTDLYGPAPVSSESLFDEGILSVKAHTCDRDFMHMTGYVEFQPVGYVVMRGIPSGDEPASEPIRPGRSFATYTSAESSNLTWTKLPFFTNEEAGFLGTDKRLFSGETVVYDLQPCSQIAHCSLQPFTVRGSLVPLRRIRVSGNVERDYKLVDALSCGAFGGLVSKPNIGRTDGEKPDCRIDLDVVPFYRIMCLSTTDLEAAACKPTAQAGLVGGTGVCSKIAKWVKDGYHSLPADNIDDVANVAAAVNGLASGLQRWMGNQQGDTFDGYLNQVKCAKWVLEQMQNNAVIGVGNYTTVETDGEVTRSIASVGLYWFREFSLYEVAPLWWVKCILFSTSTWGEEIDDCVVWREGSSTITTNVGVWLAQHVGKINQDVINEQIARFNHRVAATNTETVSILQDISEAISSREDPLSLSTFSFSTYGSHRDRDVVKSMFNLECFNTKTLKKEMVEELGSSLSNELRVWLAKHELSREPLHMMEWDATYIEDKASDKALPNVFSGFAEDLLGVVEDVFNIDSLFEKAKLGEMVFNENGNGLDVFKYTLDPWTTEDYQGQLKLASAYNDECKPSDLVNVQNTCLWANSPGDDPLAIKPDGVNVNTATKIYFTSDLSSNTPISTAPWVKWGQDGVGFDVCGTEKVSNHEGICSITDTWVDIPGKIKTPFVYEPTDYMADKDDWINQMTYTDGLKKPPRRCFDANHECFINDKSANKRADTGATVVLGVQDHRVDKFTFAIIPPHTTLVVNHLKTTGLLEANIKPPYQRVQFQSDLEELWGGWHFQNSEELNGFLVGLVQSAYSNLYHQIFIANKKYTYFTKGSQGPSYVKPDISIWESMWSKANVAGEILRSHVPRYLSDSYESIRRTTNDIQIMALYKQDERVKDQPRTTSPLVYGVSEAMTLADFDKSVWEPFPANRWEHLKDLTDNNGKNEPDQFWRRSLDSPTRLPFAQFNKYQLVGDLHDPAYPAALYTDPHSVFASTPHLKKLLGDLLNPGTGITCVSCLSVLHKNQRRHDAVAIGHPEWMHCSGKARIRTLQDIIEAKNDDADQPWNLLGVSRATFELTVKANLPTYYTRWTDLLAGGDRRSQFYVDLPSEAERIKDVLLGDDVSFVRIPTDSEAYNGVHKSGRHECGVIIPTSVVIERWLQTEEGFHEAKLLFIAANWAELSPFWFEVYNVEMESTTYTNTDDIPRWVRIGPSGDGVVSYDISLNENYECVTATGADSGCTAGMVGAKVSKNIRGCVACTSVNINLCTGRNRCGPPTWISRISAFFEDYTNWIGSQTSTPAIRTRQIEHGKILSAITNAGLMSGLGETTAVQKVIAAVWEIFDTRIKDTILMNMTTTYEGTFARLDLPKDGIVFEGVFDDVPITWPSWKSYNPTAAKRFEEGTGSYDSKGILTTEKCLEGDDALTNFVDYTVCNMDKHLDYLNKSVIESYTRESGVLVKKGYRGSWFITRDQMTGRGVVPFWAESERPIRDRFASWLLDAPDHCRNSEQNKFQSVCHLDGGGDIILFNPWLGGDFSPVDSCDSTWQSQPDGYVIDSQVPSDSETCRPYPTGCDESPFGQEEGFCWKKHATIPVNRIVGATQRNNLCTQTPRRNETCLHPQGTLAGPGEPAGSVYTHLDYDTLLSFHTTTTGTETIISDELEQLEYQTGGLFVAPRHSVFRGSSQATSSGKAGTLRVDPYDIAGHHIRYIVGENDLKITDVLLGSYVTLEEAERYLDTGTDWISFDEFAEEVLVEPVIEPLDVWADWACPLRQQVFLQGKFPGFRSKFPNQRRAAKLFKKANAGRFVHPTQKVGAGSFVANTKYYTANGVCVCDQRDGCRSGATSEADAVPCGFRGTLASLYDGEWRTSSVTEQTVCKRQIDWPYTGGNLRDGTKLPEHITPTDGQECGLLSRLPSYQYRYTVNDLIPSPTGSATTLSEGGECHTGRLADSPGFGLGPECRHLHRNVSHVVVVCQNGTSSETLELPRRQVDTPVDVMQRVHALRRRCDQCSAAPTFHASDGRTLPNAESSVTHPFRLATARVLASDLRNDIARAVCESVDGCPELDAIINRSQWVPATFWDTFMGDVRALLNTDPQLEPSLVPDFTPLESVIEGGDVNTDTREDDQVLWDRNWLFCKIGNPTCVDKCVNSVCTETCTSPTGENVTCLGTMDRQVPNPSEQHPSLA